MRGQLTYHHVMDGMCGVEKYSPLPKPGASYPRFGGANVNIRDLCVKPDRAKRRAAFALIVEQNRRDV